MIPDSILEVEKPLLHAAEAEITEKVIFFSIFHCLFRIAFCSKITTNNSNTTASLAPPIYQTPHMDPLIRNSAQGRGNIFNPLEIIVSFEGTPLIRNPYKEGKGFWGFYDPHI